MTISAAELYSAYQTGYHGVQPFESLSPTQQEKWEKAADYANASKTTKGKKAKDQPDTPASLAQWVDSDAFGAAADSLASDKPMQQAADQAQT